MRNQRLKNIVERHRLTFAIAIVIGIGFIMTAISMSLYITSGASSLDLSRPGYSQVREQVVDLGTGESFQSTGPLDKASLDKFTKLFNSQRNAINGLGSYNDTSLDDASMKLQ